MSVLPAVPGSAVSSSTNNQSDHLSQNATIAGAHRVVKRFDIPVHDENTTGTLHPAVSADDGNRKLTDTNPTSSSVAQEPSTKIGIRTTDGQLMSSASSTVAFASPTDHTTTDPLPADRKRGLADEEPVKLCKHVRFVGNFNESEMENPVLSAPIDGAIKDAAEIPKESNDYYKYLDIVVAEWREKTYESAVLTASKPQATQFEKEAIELAHPGAVAAGKMKLEALGRRRKYYSNKGATKYAPDETRHPFQFSSNPVDPVADLTRYLHKPKGQTTKSYGKGKDTKRKGKGKKTAPNIAATASAKPVETSKATTDEGPKKETKPKPPRFQRLEPRIVKSGNTNDRRAVYAAADSQTSRIEKEAIDAVQPGAVAAEPTEVSVEINTSLNPHAQS